MNKLQLANYNNSIVNLACSIKKYFDLDYNHNTLDSVDKILEKEMPPNVVVMLFDGMGSRLIERILGKNSFLYKNMKDEIFSVVPSTTMAATTCVLIVIKKQSKIYCYYHKFMVLCIQMRKSSYNKSDIGLARQFYSKLFWQNIDGNFASVFCISHFYL